MRAFDSGDPGTRAVMRDAPKLLDRLDPEDAEHFARVRALLDDAGLRYELDPTLVRGLDYYTRTVFEFTSDALGAQSGVGGGGRYDGLIEQLDGPPTPASGWAAGVERMLLATSELPTPPELVDLYVAVGDRQGARTAFELALEARRAGPPGAARARRPLAEGPAQARRPARRALRRDRRRERFGQAEGHGVGRGARHGTRRRDPRDPPLRTTAVKHAPRPNDYRDLWCGELTADRADTQARVAGWVHRRRDHGGLIFIDLRDRSGIVQLVFHPESAPEAHERAHALRSEDVISVGGTVTRRDPQNVNPNLATGEIELAVSELEILADAETPPFPLDDDGASTRSCACATARSTCAGRRCSDALALRHRVIATMREVLNDRDFLEIETPFLTRSTPEGARDFLVPARMQPGSFYALPQSPQLFKQLLMIGGFERYYQIARCFRDEDTRADRQPEFTQLDVEMAFVDEDDVIDVMEAVMGAVFERERFDVPPPPWPRMTFAEAVARFGIDRPDTRFGLELHDLGEALAGTEFKVFAGALESGGVVRGINAGARELSRSELDALTELAKQHGAKGLVWAFVAGRGMALADRQVPHRRRDRGGEQAPRREARRPAADRRRRGVDRRPGAQRAADGARAALRSDPGGPPRHPVGGRVPGVLLGRGGAALGRGAPPVHRPRPATLNDPAHLSSRAYDLVLDGAEIGGGSIRINRLDIQQQVFELLGIGPEEAQARFGFLLDALRYGAPAARRDRDGHRSDRHRARRRRVDPRRDRVPEGGERRRSADRRARPGRRGAAARARPAAPVAPV